MQHTTPNSSNQEKKFAVVTCAVSHLPAGHPDACGDCDPCIMHNRQNQLEALYEDWERMYWDIQKSQAALPDLIEAADKAVRNWEVDENLDNLDHAMIALRDILSRIQGGK